MILGNKKLVKKTHSFIYAAYLLNALLRTIESITRVHKEYRNIIVFTDRTNTNMRRKVGPSDTSI